MVLCWSTKMSYQSSCCRNVLHHIYRKYQCWWPYGVSTVIDIIVRVERYLQLMKMVTHHVFHCPLRTYKIQEIGTGHSLSLYLGEIWYHTAYNIKRAIVRLSQSAHIIHTHTSPDNMLNKAWIILFLPTIPFAERIYIYTYIYELRQILLKNIILKNIILYDHIVSELVSEYLKQWHPCFSIDICGTKTI